MKDIKIFGKEVIEEKTIAQFRNCLTSNEDIGVLTADAHFGYTMPIGGALAIKDKISPTMIGFDIACGNKAVRTNVKASDIEISKVMDEISKRISFDIGRANREPVEHIVLDKIKDAAFSPQRKFYDLAVGQLSTVGSGNHFVDLFKDDEGFVWIGVHFGSRGFGHKTTTGFIALSQGLRFEDRITEGSPNKPPILFDINSQLGQDYIAAMQLAGEYAYAGRDIVVNKVLEILGTKETTFEVHNHHNFAWLEEHFGEKYWVVRKGCTPAFPGQYGFIGATMADTSVIVIGKDCEDAKNGLYSTVHGAGRVLSRTQAAGKKKWMKNEQGFKRPVVVGKGLVDFNQVKATMKSKGIELRGAGADEAPQCYKKLEEVLGYQGDTIEIVHSLYPIGVAMAGSETYDPYKD